MTKMAKKEKYDIPVWLTYHEEDIVLVECYEQSKMEGFLICNLDRAEYENLSLISPIEKATNIENGKMFFVYENGVYNNSIKRVIDCLKEYDREDLLEKIKEKFNPKLIIFKSKSDQKKRKTRKP